MGADRLRLLAFASILSQKSVIKLNCKDLGIYEKKDYYGWNSSIGEEHCRAQAKCSAPTSDRLASLENKVTGVSRRSADGVGKL